MAVEGFQSGPGLTRAGSLTRLRLAAGPASLGEASEGREDLGWEGVWVEGNGWSVDPSRH